MIRKGAAIVAFLLSLSLLTGCWDRRELNSIATVTAVAFDKEKNSGLIDMTLQIVRPSALKKQGASSEAPNEIVVSSGNTIFEAVRNANKKIDRICFYSQLRVVLVGESYARSGIDEIIDFISRTHEIRKYTLIAVAHGAPAGRMLTIKHGINTVQADTMEGILKGTEVNSDVASGEVIGFLKKMTSEGNEPVAGVFKIGETESYTMTDDKPDSRQELVMTGAAAFQKTKMVGFLNDDETRGLNFLTGAVKGGGVRVPALINRDKKISIEIKKAKSSISPVMEKGRLRFNVQVTVSGNIMEAGDATDVSAQEKLQKINSEFETFIKEDVVKAVDASQKTLKTDVLGFGRALEEKYPAKWKTAKDKWKQQFPTVDYSVQVKTNLSQTGMLLKPMQPK